MSQPLGNGHDLPHSIRAVPVYDRGILDRDHKNPRTDFRRIKDKLLARKLAVERDGQIWAV